MSMKTEEVIEEVEKSKVSFSKVFLTTFGGRVLTVGVWL